MAISPNIEDFSEFWKPDSRPQVYEVFGEFIEASHHTNFQSLQEICKNYEDSIVNVFDGKVKSLNRLVDKASQELICNDISRARIVFTNLRELWVNFANIILDLKYK